LTALTDWHIPYHHHALTLQNALDSLAQTSPADTPYMLQWAELLHDSPLLNHGVSRQTHDAILIALGRGMDITDEAFGFGFLLGSVARGVMHEQGLHAYISRYLSPMLTMLTERDQNVFREGIKMAYIFGCVALDRFDFHEWREQPLRVLRDAIGLDHDVLMACYAVEQRRYPKNVASARLLPPAQQVAAF
jgi:hypothetical protein